MRHISQIGFHHVESTPGELGLKARVVYKFPRRRQAVYYNGLSLERCRTTIMTSTCKALQHFYTKGNKMTKTDWTNAKAVMMVPAVISALRLHDQSSYFSHRGKMWSDWQPYPCTSFFASKCHHVLTPASSQSFVASPSSICGYTHALLCLCSLILYIALACLIWGSDEQSAHRQHCLRRLSKRGRKNPHCSSTRR